VRTFRASGCPEPHHNQQYAARAPCRVFSHRNGHAIGAALLDQSAQLVDGGNESGRRNRRTVRAGTRCVFMPMLLLHQEMEEEAYLTQERA